MKDIKIFFDPLYGAFPFKPKRKRESLIKDIFGSTEELETKPISKYEKRFYPILDTPEFQRLKFLKQAGFLWLIHPSATHTRFAHSLGCWHLGSQALEYVKVRIYTDENTKREIFLSKWLEDKNMVEEFLLSSLLHDIGHFPFSHVLEANKYYRDISHEKIAIELIKGKGDFYETFVNFYLKGYSPQQKPLFLSEILHKYERVDTEIIAAIISKDKSYIQNKEPEIKEKILVMIELINGLIDLDRIDHYHRDAYFIGFKLAAVSPVALLANIIFAPVPASEPSHCIVYLTDEGVMEIFGLLESRDALRAHIFNDPENLAYISMLNTALEFFLDENPELRKEVIFWTDDYLLSKLSDSKDVKISKLISRIKLGQPYFLTEKIYVANPSKREQNWLDELKREFITYLQMNHGLNVDEGDIIFYIPKGFFYKKPMLTDDWLKFDALYHDEYKMPLVEIAKYQRKIEYFRNSLEDEQRRNCEIQVFTATKEIKYHLEKYILQNKERYK